jgi:hypothetical protein
MSASLSGVVDDIMFMKKGVRSPLIYQNARLISSLSSDTDVQLLPATPITA